MPQESEYLFAFGCVIPDSYILIVDVNAVVSESSSFLIVLMRIFAPRNFAQSMYAFPELLCAPTCQLRVFVLGQ